MHILCDCDNVLANFNAQAVVALNNAGMSLPHDALDYAVEALDERSIAIINDAIKSCRFCLSIPTIIGSQVGIGSLRQLGHKVTIVTKPWQYDDDATIAWKRERVRWLKRYFDVPISDVVFAYDKRYVDGDILIDDSYKNVNDWCYVHPSGVGFLWDMLHNKDQTLAPNMVRVFDWEHILETI